MDQGEEEQPFNKNELASQIKKDSGYLTQADYLIFERLCDESSSIHDLSIGTLTDIECFQAGAEIVRKPHEFQEKRDQLLFNKRRRLLFFIIRIIFLIWRVKQLLANLA